MTIFDVRPEKAIAAKHCSDQPTYLGTDAEGAVHYWSIHDRRVIVVEDWWDGVGTCDLSDCDRPLAKWRAHTADERGWVNCKIASGDSDDAILGALA